MPEAGSPVTLGLRPETIRIDAANPVFSARVEITENLGGSTLIYAVTQDGTALIVPAQERTSVRSGDTLPLAFSTAPHVFDAEGKNLRLP